MAPLLAGQWAVVTGASAGIGRAVSFHLAKEGASLILAARREDLLREVAKEALAAGAARVEVVAADLATPAGVEALAARTLELVQDSGLPLCVLVNNSGMSSNGLTALQGDPDEWDTMLALNLSSPMRLTRRLAPTMDAQGFGTIVNVASALATIAFPGAAAYAATKWGLRGWSKCLHQDLSPKGIRVVSLNPAFVATDMTAPLVAAGIVSADGMMSPHDVAEAVLLALRLSPAATPEEITLLNKSVVGEAKAAQKQ